MTALSKVLRDTTDNGLMFWCPGCDGAHRVKYLGDCTHALAGQTVDLPPWPD